VEEDLRKFKQLMEAGEIPTTQGQPRGSCSWFRGSSRDRNDNNGG
jgi:hypothetical protein